MPLECYIRQALTNSITTIRSITLQIITTVKVYSRDCSKESIPKNKECHLHRKLVVSNVKIQWLGAAKYTLKRNYQAKMLLRVMKII
jgi:hypothetical protein